MSRTPRPARNHARLAAIGAAVMVVLGASACQERTIRIEMTADAGRVERSFATNRLDEDASDRVADMYGSGPRRPADGGGVEFAGAFSAALPSEVGNRNGVAELPAELGTAMLYFESFGREADDDSSDEWRNLQQRMEAGELWVRLFGRWAERHVPDESRREELRSYIETVVVPMTNNVMLMYGSMQATAQSQRVGGRIRDAEDTGPRTTDESFWRQVFMPLLLALAIEGGEEGFFTPEEAHDLLLVSIDGNAGNGGRDWTLEHVMLEALTRQVRRFAPDARRLTVGQLLTSGISFYFYATTSPDRTDLLLASPAIPESDKERLRAGDRFISMPPPYGIKPRGTPRSTRTEVSLTTGSIPYLTNGRWDAETGQVVFKTRFFDADNRTVIYQPIFYAAWSLPAVERQRRLFGSVLLMDEDLADYCMWERMLSERDRLAWSEALLTLERDGRADDLATVIRRLPDQQPPEPLRQWIERETGPMG